MLRKIIEIDKERGNGSGACAKACHEGAIAMAGGANPRRLLRRLWGLPSGMPDWSDPLCRAGSGGIRRKGGAGEKGGDDEGAHNCTSGAQRLLIAADCTAYACAGFHDRFMKDRITLIGCPKLDMVSYAEKLSEIIRDNEIKSVTVVRMEVPCCGGLTNAVKAALQQSGKMIPWQVCTISTDGNILED